MEINIPIFRAKKIDSDEYVKGYLVRADDYDADADEDQVIYFIMDKMENYRTSEVWDFVQNSRIDPTTLSIHFPNIIDSQGNKIFASLQEDGKGGDILDCRIAVNCDKPTRLKTIKYTKPYRFKIGVYDIDAYARKYIIGIQE